MPYLPMMLASTMWSSQGTDGESEKLAKVRADPHNIFNPRFLQPDQQ